MAVGALAAGAMLVVPALPAGAKGAEAGGAGPWYYLTDSQGGVASNVLEYGSPNDRVYAGDFNADNRDSILVRRGGQYFVRNALSSGPADYSFYYGDPGDTVLVGDWNGDGTDTLAVRRGGQYFIKNTTSTGPADYSFYYGNPGDTVLVGDWNGDGTDTLAVRRGGQYFVKNSTSTGPADYSFYYGNPGDTVLVGDWNGDNTDTLTVRRGGQYFVKNSTSTGPADFNYFYGDPTDVALVGDWNGDGTDTLGVRRNPVKWVPGDGRWLVGSQVAPARYRSGAGNGGGCYWERRSNNADDLNGINANDFNLGTRAYVDLATTDVAFETSDCGAWAPVYSGSYVDAPRDGDWLVGADIRPGLYTATTPGECYWARVTDFRHELSSIIDNDYGSYQVTVLPTDTGLTTSRCGFVYAGSASAAGTTAAASNGDPTEIAATKELAEQADK
ncbi:hypothetical protein [Georgenia sp. SYP-B2076]|uniref:hypothetical protein n=1 Tax=Georgenia sp. SYP-B2076 TaxID=2495881 RepID=UPI000F8D6971|nr:hypothetical protein [Georgenia sp. SYP-B2076]